MEKKTFDFSKVEILSLDGKKMGTEQLRAEVCNSLYMQGQDITECELGRKLWKAIDENKVPQPVEISEEEEKKQLTVREVPLPHPHRPAEGPQRIGGDQPCPIFPGQGFNFVPTNKNSKQE